MPLVDETRCDQKSDVCVRLIVASRESKPKLIVKGGIPIYKSKNWGHGTWVEYLIIAKGLYFEPYSKQVRIRHKTPIVVCRVKYTREGFKDFECRRMNPDELINIALEKKKH